MRTFVFAMTLMLAWPQAAIARVGGTVDEVKQQADRPDVHHVSLILDHGKIVMESWWAMPDRRWTLAQAKAIRAQIAGDLAQTREWRTGTGIDDDLRTSYADGSWGGINFVGEGEVESVGIRSGAFDEAKSDGYETLELEIAEERR